MPAVPEDRMFLATSTSCGNSRVPPEEDKSTDWDSFTAEYKACKFLKSAGSRTQAIRAAPTAATEEHKFLDTSIGSNGSRGLSVMVKPLVISTGCDGSADKFTASESLVSSPSLRQQEQEIREVIDTVHENIDHQRSDLRFCLPELKEVLIDLLQDHCSDTDHFAKELGVGPDMVIYWDLRLDRLVDEAKEALNLIGIFLNNEEDLDDVEND